LISASLRDTNNLSPEIRRKKGKNRDRDRERERVKEAEVS
jgi:hypothetical protein